MPLNAVTFSLIAAAVSSAALLVITLWGPSVSRIARPVSIAAGGMLLTMLGVHIAPEALSGTPSAWMFMLCGVALGLVLQVALKWLSEPNGFPGWITVGREVAVAPAVGAPVADVSPSRLAGRPSGAPALLALAPLLAIALHSLVDGAVYGLAFTGGEAAGTYVVSALILHEVPEAFVAFALASAAGLAVRHAALSALAATALTTPAGAALSVLVLLGAAEAVLPALFAFSAGLLTYVACGPLLSPLYRDRNGVTPGSLASLGAGVALAGLLMAAPLPHAAIDGHMGPVHAQVHEHAPGDGHVHPTLPPFR